MFLFCFGRQSGVRERAVEIGSQNRNFSGQYSCWGSWHNSNCGFCLCLRSISKTAGHTRLCTPSGQSKSRLASPLETPVLLQPWRTLTSSSTLSRPVAQVYGHREFIHGDLSVHWHRKMDGCESDCAVCLAPYQQPRILQCGHTFCTCYLDFGPGLCVHDSLTVLLMAKS